MATIRIHRRRIVFLTLFIAVSFVIYLELIYDAREHVRSTVILSPSHLACQHPKLSVNESNSYRFFHKYDPIVCTDEEDWVTVRGSLAVLSKRAVKAHGEIECRYSELIRNDDDKTTLGVTSISKDDFLFTNSDFYDVSCSAADGKSWTSILAGIRSEGILKEDLGWNFIPEGAVKLNVLILGFDSLSRTAFMQTLPKSYRMPCYIRFCE